MTTALPIKIRIAFLPKSRLNKPEIVSPILARYSREDKAQSWFWERETGVSMSCSAQVLAIAWEL